ncbi:MAG: FHA domain-containing protein [Acidobacteriota bacterium]|nr:FHA domain-containing protein [Acidobacteriota bacterium]
MAKLLVHESAGVREFEMVDNEVHIGRELDNTLRLADPSISRHHAVIRQTGNGYEVQDLQSSNGVLLNGSRIQTAPLRDGDRVTLGQIQITFMDPAEQAATVAVQRTDQPAATGTVRMSPDQMAQVHGTAGVPAGPPAMPVPPPPPAPVTPPPPSPIATTPAPMHAMPEARAPEFGHFTDPGVPPARPGSMPLPVSASARPHGAPAPVVHGGIPAAPVAQSTGFLGKFLPPIPDDAQPTGERGDFITRLIAVIIDSLVMIPIIIVMVIFSILIPILARMVPALGAIAGCLGMVLYLVVVFGYFLYFIPRCVSKYGATIGKKMMKLRIVPEDDPHGRLTFGQALIRQICHIANFTIGYLLIFGAERKAVHDMITKTIVIKVDR